MKDQEEKIEIVEPKSKPGLVRRYLTGTTSLVGSVSSVVNTVKVGADAIGGGVEAITASVAEATSSTRSETFEQACVRLSVDKSSLPRIHNQILVQLYGSAGVAVLAAVVTAWFIASGNRGVLVPLISAATGLGSLAMFAQSSVQALQIRERKLGMFNRWLASPSEWFPSRLPFKRRIPMGDSRRDPSTLVKVASMSRMHFLNFGVFVVLAAVAVIATPAGGIPGGALLCVLVAMISAGRAIALSNVALQAAEGMECDLIYWLARPYRWVP